MTFSTFEKKVLKEIAASYRQREPKWSSWVKKPLGSTFDFLGKTNSEYFDRLVVGFQSALSKVILKAIQTGGAFVKDASIDQAFSREGLHFSDVSHIRTLPFWQRDRISLHFRNNGAHLLVGQGALLGAGVTAAELLPFAQVTIPALVASDILLATTSLARNAACTGTCYGFSMHNADSLPHLVAALSPPAFHEDSLDRELLLRKAIVEADQFMAEYAGKKITRKMVQKYAPTFQKLITKTGKYMGLVMTERKLAIGLPVAGALLNSGLNMMLLRRSFRNARNYYRRLCLEEKYGIQEVSAALKGYQQRQLETEKDRG